MGARKQGVANNRDIADEHPEATTSHDDVGDCPANHEGAPADGHLPPTPTLDAQPPYQLPDHDGYDTTSDHN